jgi:hypothetical protein
LIGNDRYKPWLFGVARGVAADFRAKRREDPTELEPASTEDPLAAKRELLRQAASQEFAGQPPRAIHDLRSQLVAPHDLPANMRANPVVLARAFRAG